VRRAAPVVSWVTRVGHRDDLAHIDLVAHQSVRIASPSKLRYGLGQHRYGSHMMLNGQQNLRSQRLGGDSTPRFLASIAVRRIDNVALRPPTSQPVADSRTGNPFDLFLGPNPFCFFFPPRRAMISLYFPTRSACPYCMLSLNRWRRQRPRTLSRYEIAQSSYSRRFFLPPAARPRQHRVL